ncbi:MAG: hypothetical protein A2381_06515 [Bdellovibrionales bacterium RIFOXYB1_FULL_37_110]|nr:MAG: hypothetical protein A2181_08535 [Bdellovibrionales bacterium RIFOXYA1_FULL_38_20]OFZ50195.1 MAG: hypothetical protein A2417_19365 [Bdellovibrionales bacterium RIFOXYC1_FULL_37_79]OFZ57632.1 MAG: hypothetical protein A2381_06515 [Bdellovibrionales bacterium RIFOXYB1_FULL_37_110]OFZ61399.1 MAG: hypothetical protein A2577_00880 [Bdellovibrionales bacterium RIFOXYD1_FULL_36_51]
MGDKRKLIGLVTILCMASIVGVLFYNSKTIILNGWKKNKEAVAVKAIAVKDEHNPGRTLASKNLISSNPKVNHPTTTPARPVVEQTVDESKGPRQLKQPRLGFKRDVFSKDEINYKHQQLRHIRDRENEKFHKSRGLSYQEHLEAGNLPTSKNVSLMGVDEVTRIPKYFRKFNWDGAKSIKVANIWMSTTLNPVVPPTYAIDGGNSLRFLGIWDGGAVEVNHAEFAHKVTVMDGSTVVDEHATHVAGTMIASGQYVYGASEYRIPGMAYGGYLASFDWENDISEFAHAALPGGLNYGFGVTTQMYVSNHSYGTAAGWVFDGDEHCTGDWYWYGKPSIDPDEDYKFGAYLSDVQSIDNALYNAPYLVQTWASGNSRNDEGPMGTICPKASWYEYNSSEAWVLKSSNPPDANNAEGGYDTLTPESCAKNIISVGAVLKVANYAGAVSVVMSDFSSFGPTDDGRIKPDIIAPGVDIRSTYYEDSTDYAILSSGTSMATPMISGSVALLQGLFQRYNQRYPLASTIKALIIHTAREAGPFNGPDYQFGWGLPDIDEAAKIIYNDSLTGKTYIVEGTLNQGEVEEYIVKTNGQQPKVTLVWTDPPRVSPGNILDSPIKILVNDLNVRIIDNHSTTYYPWKLNKNSPTLAATRGNNDIDNVEKIEVTQTPGNNEIWKIRVSHAGSLSNVQAYSLVYSNLDPATDEEKIALYNPTTSATLSIDGSVANVDMGNVLSSSTKTQILKIYNTGATDLVLSNLSINQALFSYTIDKNLIPPNDFATLSVLFNPRGSVGSYLAALTMTTNDSINPSLTIRYSVQSSASPVPLMQIEYIDSTGGGISILNGGIMTIANKRAQSQVSETHKIRIKSVGTGDLLLSAFSSMNTPFSWNRPANRQLSPDAAIELSFTLSLHTAGEYDQIVSFQTNVAGAANFSFGLKAILADASLPTVMLYDLGQNSITHNQAAPVLLGTTPAFESSLHELTIKNAGNVDLILSSFSVSGSFAVNYQWQQPPSSLAVGDSLPLKIKFVADNVGDYLATLSFKWKESGALTENTFSFPVEMKVRGIAEIKVSYNGTSVAHNNFIPLELGTMSTKDLSLSTNERSFLISNTGGSKLELTNLSVPPPFNVKSYPASSLLPGENTTLKIKYGNYSQRQYSGHIRFNTNLSATPEFALLISTKLTGPALLLNYQSEGVYREKYNFYLLNTGYEEDLEIINIAVPAGFVQSEIGATTLAPGNSSVVRIKMDESMGSGYRSGIIRFFTNDPQKPEIAITLTAGDISAGVIGQDPQGEQKKSTKNTPVVGCGTIDNDHNQNDPSNQLPLIGLGFILMLLLIRFSTFFRVFFN